MFDVRVFGDMQFCLPSSRVVPPSREARFCPRKAKRWSGKIDEAIGP